ncbi:MAG: hypothetical protein JNM68_12150 [Dinghuibacter sp.]|nr:hypothetical protein [Dinghuibacter sp.]
MKTILLFASLGINIILVSIACSKSGTMNEPGNRVQPDHSNRMATNSAADEVDAACIAPPPVMTYASVAQMVNNYKNNQWALINSSMGMTDARAACFRVDSLENFICNLKNMSAATGCALLKNLAVRFYYGAYSNNQEGIAPANYRKHTLIMIPAYKNASGVYVDFDPSLMDMVTCTPLPLNSIAPVTPIRNTILIEGGGGTGGNGNLFGMNHPTLAPPPNSGLNF